MFCSKKITATANAFSSFGKDNPKVQCDRHPRWRIELREILCMLYISSRNEKNRQQFILIKMLQYLCIGVGTQTTKIIFFDQCFSFFSQEFGSTLFKGPFSHPGLMGTGVTEGLLKYPDCSPPNLSWMTFHCDMSKHALTITAVCSVVTQLMCELGNSIINHIYEGSCEEQGLKKPGPSSSR